MLVQNHPQRNEFMSCLTESTFTVGFGSVKNHGRNLSDFTVEIKCPESIVYDFFSPFLLNFRTAIILMFLQTQFQLFFHFYVVQAT